MSNKRYARPSAEVVAANKERLLDLLPEGWAPSIDGDWMWVVPPDPMPRDQFEHMIYLGFQGSWKGRETTAGKASLYHRCAFIPEDVDKPKPKHKPSFEEAILDL